MKSHKQMLLRMRELAVQMENGVYTSRDRDNAQMEVNALMQQIDKIAETSKFNGVNLLDGTYNKEIRAGNTNAEIINVYIDNMSTHSNGENWRRLRTKKLLDGGADLLANQEVVAAEAGEVSIDTSFLARHSKSVLKMMDLVNFQSHFNWLDRWG